MMPRLVVAAALLLGLGGVSGAVASQVGQDASRGIQGAARPNIVVLETDDQTLEEMSVMPHTRRLIGGEGVTFANNVDSFSLCCPSRATLLTGQYAHNNGVRGNAPPEGGYYKLDSSNTLAVWLQRAGYYTALVGKYLNQYGTRNAQEIPPGWSEWHGSVDPSTYRYYGYRLNEGGTVTRYCAPARAACYQTDVYRDKANAIIRARAPQAQPFFLWVAFLADHVGSPAEPDDPGIGTPVPAPRHRNSFAGRPLPMPPSFNEADVSDKPAGIRNRPLFTPRVIDAIRESWQQRRETLQAVDEAVESIVETLRASSELDRTLILFTSDNGFFHGEHRVPMGKVLLYEPSIRVPLLLRGPGIPHGVVRTQLTANIDYGPTMLDAANVRPGRVVDGISLLPLARDGGIERGRDILVDNYPGAAHFDAIRTPHWKYAEYANGERELYDLVHDPFELRSRHADPDYAEIRAALARRLARLKTCAGAVCSSGPAVRLTVRPVGAQGCRAGAFRASVAGVDARSVTRIALSVNRRGSAVDRRAPFRVTIAARKLRGGANLVRARIALTADRVVTRDVRVRVCR